MRPGAERTAAERYRIELEMEAGGYGLALTSLCDTKEGFEQLFRALKEIDSESRDGWQNRSLPRIL